MLFVLAVKKQRSVGNERHSITRAYRSIEPASLIDRRSTGQGLLASKILVLHDRAYVGACYISANDMPGHATCPGLELTFEVI